jgi:hypothetical protein
VAHDVCGECGRPHEPVGVVPILDIDGNPLTGTGSHPPTPNRSGLLGAAIAVVVVVGGIWVLGSHGGDRGSGPADPDTAGLVPRDSGPEASLPVDEVPLAGAESDEEPSDDSFRASAADDHGDPPIGPDVIDSSVLSSLQTDARMSFLSGRAVTTLELGSAEVTTVEIGTEQILDLDGHVLLHDGSTSVAISRVDPTEVVFLGSTGEVVTHGETGYTIISPSGEAGRELFVGGTLEGVTRVLTPPVGADLLSVPGVGVLVTPATGGTYLATVRGFELWSSGRVLAATESAHVEARCDATRDCGAVIVHRATGDERSVDLAAVDRADTTVLSPDGRWILSMVEGRAMLYDTITATVDPLAVVSRGAPRWAPDSTFLAWLDISGEIPALEFAVVGGENRGTFRVGLSSLRADLLRDDAFVLYE